MSTRETPQDGLSSGLVDVGKPQSVDAETVKLERATKLTELSVAKSKAKLSPSGTSKEGLTLSNSVNKITITPPLGAIKA